MHQETKKKSFNQPNTMTLIQRESKEPNKQYTFFCLFALFGVLALRIRLGCLVICSLFLSLFVALSISH